MVRELPHINHPFLYIMKSLFTSHLTHRALGRGWQEEKSALQPLRCENRQKAPVAWAVSRNFSGEARQYTKFAGSPGRGTDHQLSL